MIKRKIDKATFDALPEPLKQYYKAEGDSFVLQAEGFDDPGELRRALERVRSEKADADKKINELSTKLDTLTDTDARRKGDIATLEKSWQSKLDTQKTEYEGKLATKDRFIQSTLVDNVALTLATDLAGDNAHILLPHIKARLNADLTGEKPLTRVLDANGQPSAASVEDLKKELSSDKKFSAVVIQSKASGGGAAGHGSRGNGGGAGAPGGKKFHELSNEERVEWYKRDPQGFEQAAKVANQPAYAS